MTRIFNIMYKHYKCEVSSQTRIAHISVSYLYLMTYTSSLKFTLSVNGSIKPNKNDCILCTPFTPGQSLQ